MDQIVITPYPLCGVYRVHGVVPVLYQLQRCQYATAFRRAHSQLIHQEEIHRRCDGDRTVGMTFYLYLLRFC